MPTPLDVTTNQPTIPTNTPEEISVSGTQSVSLDLQQFVHKPFQVQAIRVTEENLQTVETWCGGNIQTHPKTGNKFIKVAIYRPISMRQTMAFVGDWILQSPTGFRVYPDVAFHKHFVADNSSSD